MAAGTSCKLEHADAAYPVLPDAKDSGLYNGFDVNPKNVAKGT